MTVDHLRVLGMFFQCGITSKPSPTYIFNKRLSGIGLGNPVNPVAERHVTSEDIPGRDGIILVVRETPCEAGLAATIVEICHETGRIIPSGTQELGDGRVRCYRAARASWRSIHGPTAR